MRTPVKAEPVRALERVLDALEAELIEATDQDVLEAAHSLGMDPLTKGSAAFVGLKYPAVRGLADFFEVGTSAPAVRAAHDVDDPAPVKRRKRCRTRPSSGRLGKDARKR